MCSVKIGKNGTEDRTLSNTISERYDGEKDVE